MFRLTRIPEAARAALGLTLVTVTAFQQQVRDLYAVPDRGDPLFSMWRMAWVRHQLWSDPRHLFDANIFYPLRSTLTYSDSMILPAVATAPLSWLHLHPVVAYNIALLASFVLSGLAAYALARRLDIAPVGAWIAAVAFTMAPFRMNHFSHLELQVTMWMPIVLLCVHRLLVDGSAGYVIGLAVGLVAQWYSSMYYGLFLTMYAAVFALVLIMVRQVRGRRIWRAAAGVAIAAVLVAPLIIAYARTAPERGERPLETVAAFSAVPSDYLRTSSRNPVYRAVLPRAVHAERALFPGAVPIVLATVGLWPPLTATRAAFAIAGLVAFDGSLGVHGVLYRAFYAIFSPLHSVRVPARFGMLVVLTLAMLAGTGAERVMVWLRNPGTRSIAAVCLTVAFVVDVWPHYDRLPVWRSPPSIYEALPPSGSVLFEFPVHQPADRFSENLPYMYFSMWHWRPMVNGYSGFIPAAYVSALERTSTFPDGRALGYLNGLGVTHLAVHCRLWEADVCRATLSRLDSTPAVRRLVRSEWYGAPSVLYELRRDPGSAIWDPRIGIRERGSEAELIADRDRPSNPPFRSPAAQPSSVIR